MKYRVLLPSGPLFDHGEIGEVIPCDFDKYDVKLYFSTVKGTLFGKPLTIPRVAYFHRNEVEPVGEVTCATCKWAQFEMTKNKRPRPKNAAGRCTWPVPPAPAFPLSIQSDSPNAPNKWADATHKSAIWPDYTNCPVWTPA